MNIDLASTTGFGDAIGMRNFFLVHQFVHASEANALSAKFNIPVTTFGLSDQQAEEQWIKLMANNDPKAATPTALTNWLQSHAQLHTNTYDLLGQGANAAPDLSVVNFAVAEEFYDWMIAHQEMHDFEQQQLGIS